MNTQNTELTLPEGLCTFSRGALVFTRTPTQDEWEQIGRYVHAARGSSLRWMADWRMEGRRHFGDEVVAEAERQLEFEFKDLRAAEALEKLKSYRFPGNVRELENMLERAYTLCEDDRITASDLRLADSMPLSENGEANLAQIDNLEDYLEAIERKLIMQALEETRWNRTAAAQRLGLSFRSMRYRLKKLGID